MIARARLGNGATVLGGVAVLAVLALVAAYQRPRATTIRVSIQGMAYVPESFEATAGDTVVWSNDDLVPHSATADDRVFDSGSIAGGATWSWVVPVGAGGEHAYHCTYHPTMHARLQTH